MQGEKDEIMYTGNFDGPLSVLILLLPYFLEFKSISKIIHKVIYFGEASESKGKGILMDGVGKPSSAHGYWQNDILPFRVVLTYS